MPGAVPEDPAVSRTDKFCAFMFRFGERNQQNEYVDLIRIFGYPNQTCTYRGKYLDKSLVIQILVTGYLKFRRQINSDNALSLAIKTQHPNSRVKANLYNLSDSDKGQGEKQHRESDSDRPEGEGWQG